MSNTALAYAENGGTSQFQRYNSDVFHISVQTTPGSVGAGVDVIETITVPGVSLGDMVVGISSSADLASITLTAYVSAANTVKIVFANNTGGSITPTAGATIRIMIIRPTW